MYKVRGNFNVPMTLMLPTYTTVNGVKRKSFVEGRTIYGSFKTFGGTDVVINNVLVVENTAVVETWFAPDITSECAVKLLDNGQVYEIIGDPENIEMRNRVLRLKVKKVKGGA